MLRYKIYSKLLITKGDFIELYQKIRSYGFGNIAGRFLLPGSKRVKAKWNNEEEISDFWIIPEVRERWNDKSTGDKKQGIEAYFVSKYLNDRRGLKMLSIGCGTGAKERRFGKHVNFEVIEGIDVAENQIEKAQKYAAETGMKNLQYVCGDFVSRDYEKESFDVIHFNSSLHHFENVEALLKEKVRPLLKPDGYLVLFEYVGPSRLQWGKEQLEFVNRTLKEIPEKYRLRFKSRTVKKKVYRPGILRMKMIDPSEAIDSASIVPALHRNFSVVEEQEVGWNITQLLLKDIAHNFLNNNAETKKWLKYIFEREDEFLEGKSISNGLFGVYRK